MTINVQYAKMPRRMHGAATINEDGSVTVFIDPNDPPDVQRKGYLHEMEHIRNGDFDNICDKYAELLEIRAHRKRP